MIWSWIGQHSANRETCDLNKSQFLDDALCVIKPAALKYPISLNIRH